MQKLLLPFVFFTCFMAYVYSQTTGDVNCAAITGCDDCAANSNCQWCSSSGAIPACTRSTQCVQADRRTCPLVCDSIASCDDCNTRDGCTWCGATGTTPSCVQSTQCASGNPRACDGCSIRTTCSSCREINSCDWCTTSSRCLDRTSADCQNARLQSSTPCPTADRCVGQGPCTACRGIAGCNWCRRDQQEPTCGDCATTAVIADCPVSDPPANDCDHCPTNTARCITLRIYIRWDYFDGARFDSFVAALRAIRDDCTVFSRDALDSDRDICSRDLMRLNDQTRIRITCASDEGITRLESMNDAERSSLNAGETKTTTSSTGTANRLTPSFLL